MSNITLKVPDLPLSAAATAMMIVSPDHSNLTKVLAELIRSSENGIVLYPIQVGAEIRKKLNIRHTRYRTLTSELMKLGLITRSEGILMMSDMIKTPFVSITLKQNTL